MEVNDTNVPIFVAFASMSILALLMFGIGALYFIAKVFTHFQPTRHQPVTIHSHNCLTGTGQRNKRKNSVNLTTSARNRRQPQENDERF